MVIQAFILAYGIAGNLLELVAEILYAAISEVVGYFAKGKLIKNNELFYFFYFNKYNIFFQGHACFFGEHFTEVQIWLPEAFTQVIGIAHNGAGIVPKKDMLDNAAFNPFHQFTGIVIDKFESFPLQYYINNLGIDDL